MKPATTHFLGTPLSIGEALAAYTSGPAFAEFAETMKAKLLPGNVAHFVILDRDLLRPSPEEILQTRVLRTSWAAK
jgi:predicted amidohydrolase YtcJ